MIKDCKNQHIINRVMKHDYWRAVWINGIVYFRTFDENVIFHDCYIEPNMPNTEPINETDFNHANR